MAEGGFGAFRLSLNVTENTLPTKPRVPMSPNNVVLVLT